MTIGEIRKTLSSAEDMVNDIDDYLYKRATADEEQKMLESARDMIEKLGTLLSAVQVI